MSGATVIPTTNAPSLVPPTPAAQAAGPVPRNLTCNSPQPPSTTESKNLGNAERRLNCGMDVAGIIGEFEWQTIDQLVEEKIMISTTTVVFTMMKEGSPYTHIVHSAAQFGGSVQPCGIPKEIHRLRGRYNPGCKPKRNQYQG